MNRLKLICTALALFTVFISATAPALATPVLTVGFINLDGDYDANQSLFTAVAADTTALPTSGDVTRAIAPAGTAEFDEGFVSGADQADFALSMNLTGITATSAMVLPGDGMFIVTDADGDTITGGLQGTWTLQSFGFMVFSGLITDVVLNDVGTRDAMFNGPSSGSFSLDSAFEGIELAGSSLLMSAPVGHFFNQGDFNNSSTMIQMHMTPEPGLLGLLSMGGVALLRRRR